VGNFEPKKVGKDEVGNFEVGKFESNQVGKVELGKFELGKFESKKCWKTYEPMKDGHWMKVGEIDGKDGTQRMMG
jgi:hypothetical protein